MRRVIFVESFKYFYLTKFGSDVGWTNPFFRCSTLLVNQNSIRSLCPSLVWNFTFGCAISVCMLLYAVVEALCSRFLLRLSRNLRLLCSSIFCFVGSGFRPPSMTHIATFSDSFLFLRSSLFLPFRILNSPSRARSFPFRNGRTRILIDIRFLQAHESATHFPPSLCDSGFHCSRLYPCGCYILLSGDDDSKVSYLCLQSIGARRCSVFKFPSVFELIWSVEEDLFKGHFDAYSTAVSTLYITVLCQAYQLTPCYLWLGGMLWWHSTSIVC